MPLHIVLIEDDADTRLVLEAILSKQHLVVTHQDGRPLLEATAHPPDLFIIDYHLPAIDGTAICKYLRIKYRNESIPIIMISANEEIEGKIKRAGATTFLKKPFTEAQLHDTIEQLFAHAK